MDGNRRVWLALAIVLAPATDFVPAGEAGAEAPPIGQVVPLPTLGGKQFWADLLFFHDWRIQRSTLNDEHRLLDGRNFRYASGSFESCRAVLERIRQEKRLPPMRGTAVLVLHGLFRSHSSMKPLCDYLEKEGGYLVCNVEYPSTQGDVVEHAKALATIVENLDGIEQIHFVGHSLGNLVIRCYLAGSANGQGRALGSSENSENTEAAQGPDRGNRRHAPPGTVSHPLPDPRIRRFVMLAPPNHGSELAAALTDNGLFQAVAGEAGRQLGEEWPWLEANLAVPACGFGIIAGGLGDQAGYNPWLPGDDDGTITVEGTRLDGAKDFVVFPVTHSAMIRDRRVMSATLNFLRSERFSP